MLGHLVNGSSKDSKSRTFRQELHLWQTWRDGSPVYQTLRGWDHNTPIFGIVGFAYGQGWIPASVVSLMLSVLVEVIALIPLSFAPLAPLLLKTDMALIVATLAYLAWRLWSCSKLVFAAVVPLLLFVLGLGVALWQGSAV